MMSGVLLAAGTASRMGRPKQLLLLDGKRMLQHALDAMAAASLDEIVVVLGHAAPAIERALDLPPHARIVVNPEYIEGQRSSLRAGLGALGGRTRAAVVLLGDQPGVLTSTIQSALALYDQTGGPVVRTVYDGVPGHPVVLDRSVWVEVSMGRGDDGARPTLMEHPEWVVPLELHGPPPVSVDSPEDVRGLGGDQGV